MNEIDSPLIYHPYHIPSVALLRKMADKSYKEARAHYVRRTVIGMFDSKHTLQQVPMYSQNAIYGWSLLQLEWPTEDIPSSYPAV